jgi:hypothetical protein
MYFYASNLLYLTPDQSRKQVTLRLLQQKTAFSFGFNGFLPIVCHFQIPVSRSTGLFFDSSYMQSAILGEAHLIPGKDIHKEDIHFHYFVNNA